MRKTELHSKVRVCTGFLVRSVIDPIGESTSRMKNIGTQSSRQHQPTSSLAQHKLLTGHSTDFDNTKILAKSKSLTTGIIREAIEIEKRARSPNKRGGGQRVLHTWNLLLTNRLNETQGELLSQHKPTQLPSPMQHG
ncbi:hypothetical protein Trydic_g13424 [Trypoxylus dichotomus]